MNLDSDALAVLGLPANAPTSDTVEQRRAICRQCPEHTEKNGRLRCRVCGCGDPASTRRWCPVYRWGMDAYRAAQAAYEADGKPTIPRRVGAGKVLGDPPAIQRTPPHAPRLPTGPRVLHVSESPIVSMCINAADEGPRVWSTVKTMDDALGDMPHEFMVCADGATDGSCDHLPGATVIRNRTAQGCGKAKAALLAAARGQVIAFCDAHQTIFDGDLPAMIEYARTHRAIVTPLLCNMQYDENWTPGRMSNSDFAPKDAAAIIGRWGQYRVARADDKDWMSTIIMPSCFTVASRETWSAVGGWNAYAAQLGSQERGLSLRAYMADVPMVLWPGVVAGHEFSCRSSSSRNRRPYSPRMTSPAAWNMWHAYIIVMTPEGFAKHVRPKLMADKEWRHGQPAETDPAVLAERDNYLAHCKRRPDSDLVALLERLEAEMGGPGGIAPDPGGASLEPAAIEQIIQHAHGRCLELGTGSGSGTRALLDGGAAEVVTIDHGERWTLQAAKAFGDDPRVRPMTVALDPATGFYALPQDLGEFDMILLDGPPGTRARAHAIEALLPLLAEGGCVLVDDARRDSKQIDAWATAHNLTRTNLPTHRGLAKLTRSSQPPT